MWLNYRVGWGSTGDLGENGDTTSTYLRTLVIADIAPEGGYPKMQGKVAAE